jgi:hypothetical protein
MRSRHHLLLAPCIVASACLPQAKADVVAEFYRGRTVTLVVSSNAAGGYDTFARAVARYIGKHIPGNPTLIVRNMPGAGGMTATNFLYNNADKDGSVIGSFRTTRRSSRYSLPRRRATTLSGSTGWARRVAETAMVLLWHAVPVNSVRRAQGARGRSRRLRRQFDAGLFHPAVERDPGHENEAHQWLSRAERRAPRHGTARDRRPSQRVFQLGRLDASQLAARQTAKAIVQYGAEKLAELPDVPFAPDLVANDEDRLVMQAAFAPLALGGPF